MLACCCSRSPTDFDTLYRSSYFVVTLLHSEMRTARGEPSWNHRRAPSLTSPSAPYHSLGSSAITAPILLDDELKIGSKEVLVRLGLLFGPDTPVLTSSRSQIQDPMPYATFLTRFNYLPSSTVAPSPAPTFAVNPSRARAPPLPPATLAQKLARSGATVGNGKAVASQGFKPLRPASQAQAPRRMSSGAGGGTPSRRDGENQAPGGEKDKGKEKWEMEVLIDGSSPVVGRKDSGGKGKRTRVIESDDDEGSADDAAPPRKVSPIATRQERVKPVVTMMELVDDEEEEEVQVMLPPPKGKAAVKLPSGAGGKFKGLISSLHGGKSQAEKEETHYYTVSSSVVLGEK